MIDTEYFEKYPVAHSFVDMFDHLPGYLFFIKDQERRLVAANRRLVEQIGDAFSIGMRDEEYLSENMAESYLSDDHLVLEKGEKILNKVELVTRGGGMVDWSTTTKIPIRCGEEIVGLMGLTRPFQGSLTGIDTNEKLGGAIDYMKEKYIDGVSVAELASIANLSVSAFEKNFKASFNMNPKQYMKKLKIQKSCHMLIRTNEALSEIAYACGFADQSHFSREFKMVMRETPLSYRKRHRI